MAEVVSLQQLRDLLSEFFAEHASEFADTSDAAYPAVTDYALVLRIEDVLTSANTCGFYRLVDSSDKEHVVRGMLEMGARLLDTETEDAD